MAGALSIAVAGRIDQSGTANEVRLAVDSPLGSYPDGSKMLAGQDEKYVLSPLGNIVDERYTTYFQFS